MDGKRREVYWLPLDAGLPIARAGTGLGATDLLGLGLVLSA